MLDIYSTAHIDRQNLSKKSSGPQPKGSLYNRQRRDALLRRVAPFREILRHPSTDPALVDHEGVRRAAVLLAAEIAVRSDPWTVALAEFKAAEIIHDILGVEDPGPLWDQYAAPRVREHEAAVAATRAEFERHLGGKLPIAKLVEDHDISAAVSFTRERQEQIFGARKCALKPIASRTPHFDPGTAKRLNSVAEQAGMTRERVRRHYQRGGWPAVHELIEASRTEPDSWLAVFGIKPLKIGRPAESDGVTADVRSAAKQLRCSESTVWRRLKAARADAPQEPDLDPTDEGYFPPQVERVGSVVMSEPPKRRSPYRHKAEVIAWCTATRGKAPTEAQMRKWMQRGQWEKNVSAALAWHATQNIGSRTALMSANVAKYPLPFPEANHVGTIGPVRDIEADHPAHNSESTGAQADPDGL